MKKHNAKKIGTWLVCYKHNNKTNPLDFSVEIKFEKKVMLYYSSFKDKTKIYLTDALTQSVSSIDTIEKDCIWINY